MSVLIPSGLGVVHLVTLESGVWIDKAQQAEQHRQRCGALFKSLALSLRKVGPNDVLGRCGALETTVEYRDSSWVFHFKSLIFCFAPKCR